MRYNPQKIEYGETYETPRQVPQAPKMLQCLKCDSENNFIVWDKSTETQAINGGAFRNLPADPKASLKHDAAQMQAALELAGVTVVNTPAVPQGACRVCGCTWFFEWWQCPHLNLLKEWLWEESKQSLAVINALKAFVCMPADEAELDGNHLYTKYYNMLSRQRFGAALADESTPLDNDTDTPAAQELPTSSEKPKSKRTQKKAKAPTTTP
jgi:hypothetical protein